MSINNKVIALLMSLTMVLSMTSLSFAQSERIPELANGVEEIDETIEEIIEEGHFTIEQEDDIWEDESLLEAFGQSVAYADDVIVEDDEIVYEYNLPNGNTAEMIPSDTDEGAVLEIEEEGIINTLLLTDDGTLYIDGVEVIVDETISYGEEPLDDLEISKSATWDQAKNPCPKKNWVYKYTSKNYDIRIGKAFKVIGVAALAIVMAAACPELAASFATTVAGALDAIGDIYSPNSSHISSIIKVYYPKGGQNIGNGQYVKKKCGTFYTKKAYKGKSTSKTWYTIKECY